MSMKQIYCQITTVRRSDKRLRRAPCSISFYCSGALPRSGIGLDRVDPSGGYSVGNVVPACTRCNNARGAFISSKEFKLIMNMRRIRLGPDADLWLEFPARGQLTAQRRAA